MINKNPKPFSQLVVRDMSKAIMFINARKKQTEIILKNNDQLLRM